MKKTILLLLALIALGTTKAQDYSDSQALQLGLKLQYSSKTIDDLLGDIQTNINNTNVEFLRQCDLGLFLRIRIYDYIYLQPEANFSLNSVWDSVAAQPSFADAITTTFDQLQSVGLNIPVLLGFRLYESEDFLKVRAFVGPEFYTTILSASESGFNYKDYSLVAGVGLDLFNIFYLDGRVSRFASTGDLYYRVGVGLLF